MQKRKRFEQPLFQRPTKTKTKIPAKKKTMRKPWVSTEQNNGWDAINPDQSSPSKPSSFPFRFVSPQHESLRRVNGMQKQCHIRPLQSCCSKGDYGSRLTYVDCLLTTKNTHARMKTHFSNGCRIEEFRCLLFVCED